MSGRRRQALSPSLFPFLAVLICTLGTLILMLALVAQNASDAAQQSASDRRQAAKQEADEAVPPVSPRLDAGSVTMMIEEEQFRADQLVAFRDQQTADVEQRRDQLTHIEDHITRLRKQLQRLSEEVDQATGESPSKAIDQSAIVQLNEEIAAQTAANAELRESSVGKKPRVVIVPHKGPNGTDRRPIYVECTEQGVTIWPEGSHISTLQLTDAIDSANPLDAALRAVRYHALQVYGDAVPPYPLLVVRPNGIETYGAARRAMRDWDDQFGYELVPADVELAFSKPDASLKERIDLVIREAAVKQHAMHAIAQRSQRGYRKRLPTLSAASLDRDGRAHGFRQLRDDRSHTGRRSPYVSGPGYSSPSTAGSSSTAYNSASGAYDSRSHSMRRLDDHLRNAAEELRDEGNEGNSGDQPGPAAANTSLANPSPLGSSLPLGSSPLLGSSPSGSKTGSAAQPISNPFNPASGGDPIDGSLTSAGEPSLENASGMTDSGTTSGPASETSLPSPGAAFSSSADAGEPPTNSDHQPDGNDRIGGGQANSPGGNQSAPSFAAASQPLRDAQQMTTGGSGGSGQSPSTQPPSDSSRQPPPQISANSSPRSNMVRRQGRDWALPRSVAGSHGNQIVRTIRVQCYEDRFVLLPRGGVGATEMFGFSDGEINRATLELATAVRDRIDRWGAALPGGRWQPRLNVLVMPRGETRFHQLRTLMVGSGVEVTGRASQ